jgi:hypothetical protein
MADDNDTELELYINNDGDLYRQHTRPLQQLLAKAKAKGTYDRLRALRAFDAVVDAGVKKYKREFPGSSFSTSDRKGAASSMLTYFEIEHKLGNIRPDAAKPGGKKSPAQLDAEISHGLVSARGARSRTEQKARRYGRVRPGGRNDV